MSGSHLPGVTYKVKVIALASNSVTFTGKEASGTIHVPADDVSYFSVGKHYALAIHPVDSGDTVGEDSPQS